MTCMYKKRIIKYIENFKLGGGEKERVTWG
jgi:hypothetical protein